MNIINMSTKNVSVDTDINNYSLAELMAIIEVQELDPNEIVKKTNIHVNKFKKSDPTLSAFFLEVQSQLLRYAQGLIVEEDDKDVSDKIVVENYQNMADSSDAPYPSGDQQVNNWYQNQYLEQNDPNQTSKITNRQQTTQTFGNAYVPMNQTQIAHFYSFLQFCKKLHVTLPKKVYLLITCIILQIIFPIASFIF